MAWSVGLMALAIYCMPTLQELDGRTEKRPLTLQVSKRWVERNLLFSRRNTRWYNYFSYALVHADLQVSELSCRISRDGRSD